MSKTGQYALEIQEQANVLGYSTIQEAFDDGYEVIDDALVKIDSRDALAEMEKAHEAWLEEKEKVLKGLKRVLRTDLPLYKATAIKDAIDFITRGEI